MPQLHMYFKTMSVGPVWGSNPQPPAQQTGALATELTRWWLFRVLIYSHLAFLNKYSIFIVR